MELRTGQSGPPTPLQQPFNQETNAQQNTNTRLSAYGTLLTLHLLHTFCRLYQGTSHVIGDSIVGGLTSSRTTLPDSHRFICYIGIAYHLPGSFMGERSLLLTSHLKVMGLLDSARIMYVCLLRRVLFQRTDTC